MKNGNRTTIYILSGPCGVGKSTVSGELSHHLKHTALITGDVVMSMFEKGHEPPWEELLLITWENILALTRNFVRHGFNVVIDYIIESELDWFCKHLADLNVEIKYVVLRANEHTLIERLKKRGDDHLVDRSLFLLNELESSVENQRHLYDTTLKHPAEIVKDIVALSHFRISLSEQ